jgi:hypothetical protein
VQAVADVHDTPFSVLFGVAGVVWIVQLVPFQNSASVPGPPCPTDVQAVAEAHATAVSVFSPPGTGLGVVWIVQLVPFQNSANVTSVPALLMRSPTAVQAVAAAHETAVSWPAPPGLGVG